MGNHGWEYHQDGRDRAASLGTLWVVLITIASALIIALFG